MRSRLAWVLAATLALRLLVFPFNEYVHGDAVPRVEFAEAWAASPRIIRSYGDGAAQYGPLHLYLVGATLHWVDRNDAARVVNLLFGTLTVVPVFLLTRRYVGPVAATWAGLTCAAWGLHIQASTAGGSEAVSLGLMWAALAGLAAALEQRRTVALVGPLVGSALAMNLAAATRYDAWMYIPLLAAAPLLVWRDRRRALLVAAAFVGLCLPYPVFWSVGNLLAHGDAFYAFREINLFHERWAAVEAAGWREWWFRVQGLGFWPAMAFVTLTPGVAVLGALGMVDAWRNRRDMRWLVVAAVVPAAYYSLRSAIMLDFVPLARFAAFQISLLLPFVWLGAERLARTQGRESAGRAVRWSVLMAATIPTVLGAATLTVSHRAVQVLTSISPIARNDRGVMAAAEYLAATAVARGRSIAIDEDATYQDLQLNFYARTRRDRTMLLRAQGVGAAVEGQPPDVFVTFAKGARMQRAPTFIDAPRLGAAVYEERRGFGPSVRVFERVQRP